MSDETIAALTVGDPEFMVTSMIERCPKIMMLRELFMNALEAAKNAPEEKRLVEIDGFDAGGGVDKLMIWNTGPGMTASELLKICNIAASHDKEMSLTGNFGMGAKVASLPSNQLGMRYRSCTNRQVNEVILAKRGDMYGRLRRLDPETGDYVEVVNVTDAAVEDGRTVDYDWTEVVLFGNEEVQNTLKNPYLGDPVVDGQWLATYLYHRFYRLPDGVEVMLRPKANKLKSNRTFKTIPQRLEFFNRHQNVEVEGGIKIHYLYDAPYDETSHNASISGAIASAVSTRAIIHKDEMYDLKKGRAWTFDAPIFGITFGAKHISVHIELPDDYPVVPEAYRRFLQRADGEQNELLAAHFSEMVRDNRPQWLIDIIMAFSPDSTSNEDIRNELQQLLDELRVKRISPRALPNGAEQVDSGAGPASVPERGKSGGGSKEPNKFKASDLTMVPSGAKRADLHKNAERAPQIIELRDEAQIEEMGIKGRAGRYVLETGELFVNMHYPAIDEMKEVLEAEYAHSEDIDMLRELAIQFSEKTVVRNVGRTVVFALSKQVNNTWDQNALETACSPESLSVSADDFSDSLQNVRRAISRSFRTKREGDAAAA